MMFRDSRRTDPASELTELVERLRGPSKNLPGDQYLAEKFEVPPHSVEFVRTVLIIKEKIELVRSIVKELRFDEDVISDATHGLDRIEEIFTTEGFSTNWPGYGERRVDRSNTRTLRTIYPSIQEIVSYPRLTDQELIELLDAVTQLRSFLSEHQMASQDFIRAALLDGLKEFEFRLRRFRWTGYGYTVDSLKAVIGAYIALERMDLDPATRPEAEYILRKVRDFFSIAYDKLHFVKEAADTADWVLKLYGAIHIAQSTSDVIAGFLPRS